MMLSIAALTAVLLRGLEATLDLPANPSHLDSHTFYCCLFLILVS